MALYDPKADLYSILSEIEYSIDDVVVLQRQQDALASVPCITFNVSDNRATIDLGKELGFQDIEVILDFYGNTSKETGAMLQEAEAELRANGYVLQFSADVPDPDGYHHISTRFNFIK